MEKDKKIDIDEGQKLDFWIKDKEDISEEISFLKKILNFILEKEKFSVDDYEKTVWG